MERAGAAFLAESLRMPADTAAIGLWLHAAEVWYGLVETTYDARFADQRLNALPIAGLRLVRVVGMDADRGKAAGARGDIANDVFAARRRDGYANERFDACGLSSCDDVVEVALKLVLIEMVVRVDHQHEPPPDKSAAAPST